MLRLIEIGWACGGALASKVALLARNRVISSVSRVDLIRNRLKKWGFVGRQWFSLSGFGVTLVIENGRWRRFWLQEVPLSGVRVKGLLKDGKVSIGSDSL